MWKTHLSSTSFGSSMEKIDPVNDDLQLLALRRRGCQQHQRRHRRYRTSHANAIAHFVV